MRRGASSAALFVLLVLLAACQPLPQPFAEDRPPPGAAILIPKDGAGVQVLPVEGIEGAAAGDLAEAMAAALRDSDVPASTQSRNRASYALAGAARARPLAGGRAAVELRWELRGPDGAAVGSHVDMLEIAIKDWQQGDAALFARLAKGAAPELAAMLQEEGGADADPTGPRVLVRTVEGAPGDGPRALARAMAASLQHANVAVVDKEPASGAPGTLFVVAGTVTMSPAVEGKQNIAVRWTLLDAGGLQIGQVNQQNAIPAGSLDQRWGDVAYAVANAAAGGIVALLEHLKEVRAGS